jgi:hypothetical protein
VEGPKLFAPMICSVQEALYLGVDKTDSLALYQVVVKATGLPGLLTCRNEEPLAPEQEFCALFIKADDNEAFYFHNQFPDLESAETYVRNKISSVEGGGRILHFPSVFNSPTPKSEKVIAFKKPKFRYLV